MVLIDTSVWIDHLRSSNAGLVTLLEKSQVLVHPMVIGELACGNLQNRHKIIALLQNLPHAVEASHDEAIHCLEQNELMGKGIGWIDVHLLAAVRLSPNAFLWTKYRRLLSAAKALKCHWHLES